MDKFDVLVIGAGSGGVRAARVMAQQGARVGVIENSDFGGTCVNLGCVPKKLFTYAAHYSEDFQDALGFGWQQSASPEFHWPTLRDNKNQEISRLNNIYQKILDDAGVTSIRGTAQFKDAHHLQVSDAVYAADNILIATGSWPWLPDIPGIELAITSNEAFHLEHFPEQVAVIGGGYIAVEFAGIFRGLGCEVSLLYRGEQILRQFDESIRTFLQLEVQKKGIDVRTGTNVTSISSEEDPSRLCLTLDNGEVLHKNCVMYATGRKPRVKELCLERAGVETAKNGGIVVDDYYRTTQPHIFAIGDVVGKMPLTPVAIAEATAVAKTIVLNEPARINYNNIPTTVFSQPDIGSVGLTEEQARQKCGEITVFESDFKYLKHTLTDSSERVYIKLIVEKASDLVVGVHMVGPGAGEITQGMAVALQAGATKAVFDATISIHPTIAEEFVSMREHAR